jgi:hypothetical protein
MSSSPKLEVDDKPGFTLEDLDSSIVQPEFETPESVQTKRPMGKNTEEIEGPSPQKIVKTTFDTKAVTNYEVLLKGDHSVTFSKGGALKDFLAWIDSKFVLELRTHLKLNIEFK